jgi:hypothetical protein
LDCFKYQAHQQGIVYNHNNIFSSPKHMKNIGLLDKYLYLSHLFSSILMHLNFHSNILLIKEINHLQHPG